MMGAEELSSKVRVPGSILKDPSKKMQSKDDSSVTQEEQHSRRYLRWFYGFQSCKIVWCLIIMSALSHWNGPKDSQSRTCGFDPEVSSRPYVLTYNDEKLLMCWYECPPKDFSYSQLRANLDLYHPEPIFNVLTLRLRGFVCQPGVKFEAISSWNQMKELLNKGLCAKEYRASAERYPKDGVCRKVEGMEMEVKEKGRTRIIIYNYAYRKDKMTEDKDKNSHNRLAMFIYIVPDVVTTLVALHMREPVFVAAITIMRSLIYIGFATKIYIEILSLGVHAQNSGFRQHLSTFVFANLLATIIITGIFLIHGMNQRIHYRGKIKHQERFRTANIVHWPDEQTYNSTGNVFIEKKTQ